LLLSVIFKNLRSKLSLGTYEVLILGMLMWLIYKLIPLLMKSRCLLIRLSNKRSQDNPLNLIIPTLLLGTNPLTRGVLIPFLSPQIRPLLFHKEPKLHKRSKPLKIDPFLSL